VLPLAVPQDRPKGVIVFDLAADPEALLAEPADAIYDRVFTPAADMPEDVERIPLKMLQSNHVPMIAPLGTLKGVDTGRIGLDPDRCRQNATRILRQLPVVREKVMEVFAHAHAGPDHSPDPDRMLYSGGFIPAADRHLLNKILAIAPKDLGRHLWSFQDERLQLMLFRYRARNFPDTLNAEERRTWDRDRRARLVETEDPSYFTLRDFEYALAQLREARSGDPAALEILDRVEAWPLACGISDL
jgi:exodeoxyribonuclease-1